jgi:hypothetical protein
MYIIHLYNSIEYHTHTQTHAHTHTHTHLIIKHWILKPFSFAVNLAAPSPSLLPERDPPPPLSYPPSPSLSASSTSCSTLANRAISFNSTPSPERDPPTHAMVEVLKSSESEERHVSPKRGRGGVPRSGGEGGGGVMLWGGALERGFPPISRCVSDGSKGPSSAAPFASVFVLLYWYIKMR